MNNFPHIAGPFWENVVFCLDYMYLGEAKTSGNVFPITDLIGR